MANRPSRQAASKYLLAAFLAVALHVAVLWQLPGLPRVRGEGRPPVRMVAVLLAPVPAASTALAKSQLPMANPVPPPVPQEAVPPRPAKPARQVPVPQKTADEITGKAAQPPVEVLAPAPVEPQSPALAQDVAVHSPSPLPAWAASEAEEPSREREAPADMGLMGERTQLRLLVAITRGTHTQMAQGQLNLLQQTGRHVALLQWNGPERGEDTGEVMLRSEGVFDGSFGSGDQESVQAGQPGEGDEGGLELLAAVWHWRQFLRSAEASELVQGRQWHLRLKDESGAGEWLWQLERPDVLRLAERNIQTLRLSATPPDAAAFTRVDLWFAPRMDFLPVMIRLRRKDGSTVDLLWQETLS